MNRQLAAAAMSAALVVGLVGASPALASEATTATLTGTVTLDGAPAANVEVVLSAKAGGEGTDVRTDANGVYTFDEVPLSNDGKGRTWGVRVEIDQDAAPLAALTTFYPGTSRQAEATKVLVPPTGATVDLALVESATVTGKAVRADGTPLAGASVSVSHDTRVGWVFGETDAQGDFVIHGLDSGPVSIEVSADGSAFRSAYRGTASATLTRGETVAVTDVVAKYHPGEGTYRAKVKNGTSRASLYYYNVKTGLATVVSGLSKKKGSVTVKRDVQAGKYRLVVAGTNVASKKFTVKEGKTTKVGTLKATKKRTTVSGKVKRPNGKPYRSATVTLFDSYGIFAGSTTTDRKGRYSIKGLVKGRYALQVGGVEPVRTKFAASTVKFTVKKGKNVKKNIKVKKTFTVKGRITDGGTPVSGLSVARLTPNETGCVVGPDNGWYAQNGDCAANYYTDAVVTDKNGRFTLKYVPGKKQRFMIWDQGLGGYETVWKTLKVKKGKKLNVTVSR